MSLAAKCYGRDHALHGANHQQKHTLSFTICASTIQLLKETGVTPFCVGSPTPDPPPDLLNFNSGSKIEAMGGDNKVAGLLCVDLEVSHVC